MKSYDQLIEAARIHYESLTADINNASTRLEHLRLTALAQEARNLLTELENFGFGLVYSHSLTARSEYSELDAIDGLDV